MSQSGDLYDRPNYTHRPVRGNVVGELTEEEAADWERQEIQRSPSPSANSANGRPRKSQRVDGSSPPVSTSGELPTRSLPTTTRVPTAGTDFYYSSGGPHPQASTTRSYPSSAGPDPRVYGYYIRHPRPHQPTCLLLVDPRSTRKVPLLDRPLRRILGMFRRAMPMEVRPEVMEVHKFPYFSNRGSL